MRMSVMAAWLVLGLLAHAGTVGGVERVAVFTGDGAAGGKAGYHTFRIPALVQTASGALLAFCEGRRDGVGDAGKIDLVLKRSVDGGKSWGPLSVVYAEAGDTTIGNPVPIVDHATGTVHLVFCRNNRDGIFYTRSTDDGRTWQAPRAIMNTPACTDALGVRFGAAVSRFGTGPGHGVRLDGRLVVPIWCQGSNAQPFPGPHFDTAPLRAEGLPPAAVRDPAQRYFSGVLYSDDQGGTWHTGGLCTDWVNETTLAALPDGTLLSNARNNRGYYRVTARSTDRGATFTGVALDRALVDNQCEGSLAVLTGPDGRAWVLFANAAVKGSGTAPRINVTLRASADGGATWPLSRTIDPGPSAYVDLCPLADGGIGILYERGARACYEEIAFTRVTLDGLRAATPRPSADPGR
jgi:sialidase-1